MTENTIIFDSRNILIVILTIVLILAIMDINIFYIIGNFIQVLSNIFMPFIRKILSLFGYSTGTILNETAELASNTAKLTIDIAEGTIQSVGGLLQKASQGGLTNDMKKTFSDNFKEVPASSPMNPIQATTASKKSGFCYVGDFQGNRGCVEVSEHQKCMSEKIFPTKKMCLNPTMTPNLQPQQNNYPVTTHQL
jgi:hypothetical protein